MGTVATARSCRRSCAGTCEMTSHARLAAVAVFALLVGGCVAPQVPLDEGPPPSWPVPPAPPRIAFVKAFSRPEHLGIDKGLLQRLADLLFGGSEARLVKPMAVAVVDDTIYVADPGAKGVHRFAQASGRYDLLQAEGGAPLASPVALARGGKGEVYVSDSALRRVFVIRPGARFASPIPLQAELKQPTGIAADPATGALFVVDTAAHTVFVFSADGALKARIGQPGAGDGAFNYPTLAWRDSRGRLYVTDSLNFRTQIFDALGHFEGKFGRLGDGSGDSSRPKGVATDSRGHVYVVDSLFHAIQIFDASGRFLLSVGGLGSDKGQFWLPVGIFITDDDTIYVTDVYNRRVQVFRYVGGAT